MAKPVNHLPQHCFQGCRQLRGHPCANWDETPPQGYSAVPGLEAGWADFLWFSPPYGRVERTGHEQLGYKLLRYKLSPERLLRRELLEKAPSLGVGSGQRKWALDQPRKMILVKEKLLARAWHFPAAVAGSAVVVCPSACLKLLPQGPNWEPGLSHRQWHSGSLPLSTLAFPAVLLKVGRPVLIPDRP